LHSYARREPTRVDPDQNEEVQGRAMRALPAPGGRRRPGRQANQLALKRFSVLKHARTSSRNPAVSSPYEGRFAIVTDVAPIFEKIFIADDSGFFAVGLLIYEYYRGRRDLKLNSILALSVGTSVIQAVHKLERLGVHTAGSFDARVAAAICRVSIAVILLATRIRKLPLPAELVLPAGGITYPLYLLHMQMG